MNTRRRITLIFSIIYCALLVLLIGLNCFGPGRRASYTADSDSVSYMGYTYVSDNTHGFGDLYQISESGDVKKVYLTRMRSYVSGYRVRRMIADIRRFVLQVIRIIWERTPCRRLFSCEAGSV